MKYAEIVVNVPRSHLDQTFTYEVTSPLESIITPGQLVWVPFGSRRLQGIVVALNDSTAFEQTRPIQDIVDPRPMLSLTQIELARWTARRYLAPLSQCIWLMLPPGIEEKADTIYRVIPGAKMELPLTQKENQLLELVSASHGLKSTRVPASLKGAIAPLLEAGILAKQAHIQPPRAKPRHVKSVRLIGETREIEHALEATASRSLRERALQVLAESGVPVPLAELCERLGCKPAAIRKLAQTGVLEILPGARAFRLTPKYFETVPALNSKASRVLVFMREYGNSATFEQLYDATRVTPSTLRGLQEQGLIEQVETTDRVQPGKPAPGPVDAGRQADRSPRIVDFLRREGGSGWISAVYAATGASAQDLRRLERAGIVRLEEQEVIRDPLAGRSFQPQVSPSLTGEQAAAFAEIRKGLDSATGSVYLLHGVTGSGKTEIYIDAIDHVLKAGRQAIALVPEIALTPQTIQRFGERFGARIGVIHSDLSYGERYDTWRRARDGKIDILIGPRSALFAPLPNLGLIVVDEEHEPSYKQEADAASVRLPLYHTREIALELARLSGASVILGSATPDVETYYRAQMGEFKLLELPRRIIGHGTGFEPVQYQDLPPVEVVDLRAELREGNTSIFSRSLSTAMGEALAAHQQVILFLNRRGSASTVLCRTCGHAVKCPRCNNPFTLHQYGADASPELVCHHCGKRGRVPKACPDCGSTRIRGLGLGTEKLEQTVRETFPAARTLRWDRDVTPSHEAHERILESFTRGEADILIGTQMIAKGLDLPRVTLVGVVNADTALNLPDFRASERTFQLLTQVTGRAGRSALGGKAIIQTYFPEHYAVAAAARHDYKEFYQREMRFRLEAAYPPYRPLVRLLFAAAKEREAQEASDDLAKALLDRIRRQGVLEVDLIGPAPAFFGKWSGQYRYHLLLRGRNARALLADFPFPPGWRIDVDPMNLL